jgi:hypothetical protein
MIPKPNGHYILIRTSRQEEKDRREKKGSIYLPASQIFMTRNLQHGEVIDIGALAQKKFPEVRIGHTLLVHHFVQAESELEAKDEHLVHQDETFNYYVVTVDQIAGKTAEAYAVWDGEKLITNPYYVFLNYDAPVALDSDLDALAGKMNVSASGLLTFGTWVESREDKEKKLAVIKMEVEALSRSGTHKEHVAKGIKEKEVQMDRISAEINGKYFAPYTVAAFNQQLKDDFDGQLEVGSVLYVLEFAAQTTIEFFGKEYRVVKVSDAYIGALKQS